MNSSNRFGEHVIEPGHWRRTAAAFAVASIVLLATAIHYFHRSGCAENAAGSTIASADLRFIAIAFVMAALVAGTAAIVVRPGHWLVRLAQACGFFGVGYLLMLAVSVLLPWHQLCR